VVDRSSFSCVGSLFHAGDAATEKALSPIRRRVGGTTRSPDDEARSADRAGMSATNVSKSRDVQRRVSKKRLVDHQTLRMRTTIILRPTLTLRYVDVSSG